MHFLFLLTPHTFIFFTSSFSCFQFTPWFFLVFSSFAIHDLLLSILLAIVFCSSNFFALRDLLLSFWQLFLVLLFDLLHDLLLSIWFLNSFLALIFFALFLVVFLLSIALLLAQHWIAFCNCVGPHGEHV